MTQRIASFDIGKLTFSFCIEDIPKINISSPIPRVSQRYNSNGSCTPLFKKIIDKVCLSGDIVFLDTFDLTKGCDKKKKLDPLTLVNLSVLLDKHSSLLDSCSIFLIGRQMDFGKKKSNPMALKISHFLYSYLLIKYALFKDIVEFPSYHKTKVLGCPKEISKNKSGRKKWSTEICISILNERGDDKNLFKLLSSPKKDDMSDCVTQLQAYKFMNLKN